MNHDASDTARLEVPAHLDSLGPVRDFISSTVAAFGLGDDAVGDLLLAVDEAVSNVVMHGGTDGQGVVEIAVLADADAVTVRIRDDARQYDPTGTAAPRLDVSPLDREQAGGFGVELIRRLVDRVGYRVADDGRNELTLVKRQRTGSTGPRDGTGR